MVKNNANSEKEEFEKYLQKIEDPDYNGQDVSWHLPENATLIERTKYDICQKILDYQQKHKLTDKETAQRINLTTEETKDILFEEVEHNG